ncbi:MAG: tRNA (guanosine(37)-N1)-methyltransferase TrmD [Aestuariivita sp.]|nr:tRNA (guanosine(37)-N1)-methyltransferase TrmD [Aestuariivita sp.]MCY4346093.1 tRNA (guanosine(37)-N1)-methyltransferase TrmD [Aestuariivita sp.]
MTQSSRTWTARVISLFPEVFPGVLACSLSGQALEKGLWGLETIDLRQYGIGKHRDVDGPPIGGGAGMVLRPDVMESAITDAMSSVSAPWPLIYLSPRGRPVDQELIAMLAAANGTTLICGRYEGLDERVLNHFDIAEYSIGDFVLSGGELAAQVVIDAVVRLLPGVVGNAASLHDESFSSGLLEYPQFTRPTMWQGKQVPEVLLSGNHAKIAAWRKEAAERVTRLRRPDLWRKYRATS